MSDELPQGWATARLEELTAAPTAITYGVLQPGPVDEAGVPMLRVMDIRNGRVDDSGPYKISKKLAEQYQRTRLCGGEVLVSVQGSVGRVAIVPSDLAGANISRTLAVIPPTRPELAKWIWAALQTTQIQSQMADAIGGTTRDSLNLRDLRVLEIPLAPSAEQGRIVAKLEKLLEKVDACQQRLARIPILLKRFRQSVLAAACSGRLTADWREKNDVDDEWPTEPLSALFTMRNGKSLTAAKRRDGDVPVYGGNGHMGNHNAANADGQVIVIGRVGAQCGNVHFVNGKVWVTDNAISLEAKRKVEPAFYAFFLRSQNLNQLSAGTGQPYVSQEILGLIQAPVVLLAEQEEIVRRVEVLFVLADQIEARHAKGKAHVEKLTQSILAKAFRGELVPQDPNDEPASALLERIKAEKDGSASDGNRTVASARHTRRKSGRSAQVRYSRVRR